MAQKKAHPYHYYKDKNPIQQLIDLAVPLGMLYVLFVFFNKSTIDAHEMAKTTGILAIALLALTLIIGSLCRIFPFLDFLKAHRKFWGILSAAVAVIHGLLVIIFYYKFDLTRFIQFSNPRYMGMMSGVFSLIILIQVTMTSNEKALTKLKPEVWKMIQMTSYIALILAVYHFFLIESNKGVFTVRSEFELFTFIFSIVAILARFLIMFLPNRK